MSDSPTTTGSATMAEWQATKRTNPTDTSSVETVGVSTRRGALSSASISAITQLSRSPLNVVL
jgi:hypothetical protein